MTKFKAYYILVNSEGNRLHGYPVYDDKVKAKDACIKLWSIGHEVYVKEV